MSKKKFSEAMTEVNDKYYEEAARYERKRKTPLWLKWGAMAACLCLVVGGIAISQMPGLFSNSDPGAGPAADPGGMHPDGVDPVIASIAVYPASENILDVADATNEGISEADAYAFDTLGDYLPTILPDGYHFENASLYETTMKNGVKYYMLRVVYTTGNKTEGDGEAEIAADPNTLGSSFVFSVMNYMPKTKYQIYNPADITESKLEEIGGTTFHIAYDDVFVGISRNSTDPSDIVMVVNSIH